MSEDLPHILVVDDDTRLRDLLRRYLSDNGFRVSTAADALEAREMLRSLAFDLLIVDVMMPGEDGLSLTASLRAVNSVPILLLTARGEPDDRIAGLEAGADDYLAKPFEPRELVLRLGTILRRTQTATPEAESSTPRRLCLGGYLFDPDRELLEREDDIIRLTSAETALLRALDEAQGVPLSREELARNSGIDGNPRTVDVQVTRLRRKIETDPKTPRYLLTVRGTGYVLRGD